MSNDIDLDSRRTLSSSLLRSLRFFSGAQREWHCLGRNRWFNHSSAVGAGSSIFQANYASTSMRVAKDEAVAAQLI